MAGASIGITPLWGEGMGARVEGVDFSEALPAETWRELVAALHRHRVLCFPGQRLTPEQFDRYGRQWGEPIPHVLDHFRMPGLPGVMTLTNAQERGEAIVKGAAYWHTDQSYEADPSSATTLHAVTVPQEGGGTFFADMVTAYDDLPDAMKRRLDGLVAIHRYGNRDAGIDGENDASPLRNDEQRARVPECRHPVVRPHPVTGRKALYAVAGTSRGIEGWPEDEAVALLRELKAHATGPKYARLHRYAVGDTVVWDTAATLHAAEPIDVAASEEQVRVMWRVSVRGRPAVLR